MTMFPKTPTTTITGKTDVLSAGTLAYLLERQKNKIYEAVFHRFMEMSDNDEINRAAIARRLGKDPAQITRWLSGPGNWTLETMTLLLIAMNAELEPHIKTIGDAAPQNFCHPLNFDNEGGILLHQPDLMSSTQIDSKHPV